MSLLDGFFKSRELISLNLPRMSADYESSAPTGVTDLPSMADVEAWEQLLIGVKTHTGQIVTPERARRCSAVLACLRILTEDISTLPLKLYKKGKGGELIEAEDHNIYTMLDITPNDCMTSMELREHMLMDLMLFGSFFNLKNEDPNSPGDIESVWPLQAGYVTRRWRELVWTYSDPLTGVSGQFTPDMVWRGSMLSANGLDGTAITLLAREAIGLLLAAEEQGARLFKYGVQSDLALTAAETLDGPIKDQLRSAFMHRHSGAGNAFMPILLEGGLDIKRIGLTAQESQYMEARAFQIQDIFRVFRIPEVLAGTSGKGSKASTYASAEQFFQSYTKHTLAPWTVRIEQSIMRDLLQTKERSKYVVKHDFSSLLRADTAGRYAAYSIGIDKGFITPGYAARQEGLPWVPTLEYYNKQQSGAASDTQDEKSAPTDQSALAGRVAAHILDKERKALIADKREADNFYSLFGGYVEDLTGAAPAKVMQYLETRRTTLDRFTPEAITAAIGALIGLCKKDS